VGKKIILVEMIAALVCSTAWYFLRSVFVAVPVVNEIEPMLIGLLFSAAIHLVGLLSKIEKKDLSPPT